MLAKLLDPFLVVCSLGGVALLLTLIRRLHHARPLSPFLLRKVLHLLIGAMTLLMTALFHSRWWALVPPALFTGVNFSGRLQGVLPDLAEDSKAGRGLWMFPLGVVLLYLAFWNNHDRGAVLAGCAALGLADPVAAIVGSRMGQRRYAGWGYGRTVEGSLAFILVAGVASGLIAAWAPGGVSPARAAVWCGALGALAEALSPHGWDNLTVPLVVAAAYRLLG